MIAQDFARVRALGAFSRGARGGTPRKKTAARGGTPRKRRDGSIVMPYGVATMRAHAGNKVPHRRRFRLRPWPDPTVRGRGQRTLYPAGLPKSRRA